MGTNYYLQHEISPEGRVEDMHICKTSAGWVPSMVGYKNYFTIHEKFTILSWLEWKLFLRSRIKDHGGKIFDEYNELIDLKDFIGHVTGHMDYAKQGDCMNHAEEALKGTFGVGYRPKSNEYWVDPEGYSFQTGEFS